MNCSQFDQVLIWQPRDYKCPCGKSYMSNAAIYTHIKQKHGGVAPGKIKKPTVQKKKARGRPSRCVQSSCDLLNRNFETNISSEQQNLSCKEYSWAFYEIFTVLNEIQNQQQFNRSIWGSNKAFKIIENFIQNKWIKSPQLYVVGSVGVGVSQFFKQVSQRLESEPWKFQQVLILIVLLVEYTIDQSNSPNIIERSPMELLIDYINPFITNYIQDLAIYLDIQDLWIMKLQNMTRIFHCFYNWMKSKNYTQYCIILI